ncbi:MAG: DcrB-related protein [Dehalococcoidales bacterium]|nr:DcrB-related protein [Dehalococcoidales bacterium]
MLEKRGHKCILMAVIVTLVLFVAGCQCGATDTTPAPAPTLPSTPTPAPAQEETAMTLYENTEHGFSIEYPEGWAENTRGAGTSLQFLFNEPEGSLSGGVTVEYRPEGISLADAVAEVKKYMEAMSPYELFYEGDITIGDGISGYEMICKGDMGTGKVEKSRYVILVREKQVLFVGVSGEPDQFDERETLVNAVIDSFKLLSSYTYVPPAPSPGGTYTNAEYGFSITYPAGWADYTTGQYGEIVDLRAATGIPEVMVRAWTEEETTTLAESASGLKSMFSEQLGDYEFLSEGEIALDDGTPAYEVVFSGTMQGYLLTCKYVIVITEANSFLIMGISLPGSFEQDEPVLDEVIGSFHLE